MTILGYKISVFHAWYDGWIGYFWDSKKRVLYTTLIPTVVIKIEWPKNCK